MTDKQIFDYIVVGSGSAGGQLAARLTESGQHQVLMLEGGGSHKGDLMVSMPAGWGAMTYSKKHSWGHMTEPERWAGGRRMMMPRGKVLGGSSSINGMIYIRGHRHDYADWVAAGAEGWGWNDLLPYFVRTEDQERIRNKYHGQGGPLHAGDLPSVHPITHAMIAAGQQAGLEQVDDFNDGTARGVGVLQVNVRKGKRSSIAANAIEPAMKRGNLKVITRAMVLRITTEAGRTAIWQAPGGPGKNFDIVVTNAGGPPPGDFRSWDREAWIKAVDANMLTPIELIKATVDGMAARGFGRIVNITSSAVKAPIDILGLSNGARSGLTGFVAGVARSGLAAQGVTINNLLPGKFDTDRLKGTLAGAASKSGKSVDEVRAVQIAQVPAKRFGTPDEFGAICAFLCSRQAGYLNGQNILPDGGLYPGTY